MYVFIYIVIYKCKHISIYISMYIYISIISIRMTLNVNIIYKYTHVCLNMSYLMQISSVTFGLGHWSWGGENRDNFVTCALQSCTVQNRALEFACVCTHNPYRIPASVAHNVVLVSHTHTPTSKPLTQKHSACPTHTYTHTNPHARTRMHARAHTHTYTYTPNILTTLMGKSHSRVHHCSVWHRLHVIDFCFRCCIQIHTCIQHIS